MTRTIHKKVMVFGRVVGAECGRKVRSDKRLHSQWPKVNCIGCMRKRRYYTYLHHGHAII